MHLFPNISVQHEPNSIAMHIVIN